MTIVDEYRENEGLPVITEDTLEVSRMMRASSPPPTAGNDDNMAKRSRPFRRVRNIVISEVEMLLFRSASIILSLLFLMIYFLYEIHYFVLYILNFLNIL